MIELALVLREHPGDEQGFERIGQVLEKLEEPGAFVFSHGEERSQDVNEYVWFGPRDGDEISLIDDFMLEVRYLAVRSADHSTACRVRDALAGEMQACSLSELRAQASGLVRSNALSILALALDDVDAASLAILEEGLRSEDTAVRHDAIVAASLTRSPKLCDALTAALGRAADERERQMLAAAASSCCQASR